MFPQQIPATTSADATYTVASHSDIQPSWQSPTGIDSDGVAPIPDTSYQHKPPPPDHLDTYTTLDPSNHYPWTLVPALQPVAFETNDSSVENSSLNNGVDQIGTLEPDSYFADAVINHFIVPALPGTITPLNWDPGSATDPSPTDEKFDPAGIISPPLPHVPKLKPASNRKPKPPTQSKDVISRVEKPKVTRQPIDPAFRACWRCKKYRKPCDHNTVCNGCLMTSGFRVWPPAIGCRRGTLHEFAYLIVPVTTGEALKQLNFEYVKPFSWRLAPLMSQQQELGTVSTTPGGDVWNRLINRMRLTYIHGPGILELLEIGARFQRRQSKPNTALREAAVSLHLVIELYHSLVSTGTPEAFDLNMNIEKRFLDVRKAIMATMDKYVHICLTARLKAWPPILLSCSMFVIGYIYLADAVAALPWPVQAQGWSDVKNIVIDLRKGLYTIAKDLLSALAKGVKMLDMDCWVYEDDPNNGEQGTRRNGQGMKLMDEDDSAFDAMADLVEWRNKFLNLLNGDIWLSTNPFEVDLLPIMSLATLFNVSEKTSRSSSGSPVHTD